MDKIKITKRQEGILVNLLGEYGVDKAMEYRMGDGSFNLSFPKSKYTPEQFALLLCGWYEIEQPFEVGDWVTTNIKNREPKTGKIYEVKEGAYGKIFWMDRKTLIGDNDINIYGDKIRKATPEEIEREKKRRFWGTLDRQENDYQVNDIVIHEDYGYGTIYNKQKRAVGFKRFGSKEGIAVVRENLTLVCPVEKRLDIDA